VLVQVRRRHRLLLGFGSLLFGVAAPVLAQTPSSDPRFGDSTWVAPLPESAGDPATPGPRVDEPDKDRTWETVLRTPFRVVFFPFRLVGRGLEGAATLAEAHLPLDRIGGPKRPPDHISIGPQFSLRSSEGLGVGPVISGPFGGPENRFRVGGIWTMKDTRRVRGQLDFNVDQPVGVTVFGQIYRRPNRRFYGVGNDAGTTRTIYLERENRVEGSIRAGTPRLELRGFAGYSDFGVGPGYNGNGAPRAIDFFGPSYAPGLLANSKVWYAGAGAVITQANARHHPTSGLQFFGDLRQVMNADPTSLHYVQYRGEARGYLPVASLRRVLMGRAAFEGVNPVDASDPIPFYRMPSSSGLNRFSGYARDRFRDRRLMILQGEYRWWVWSKLWAFLLAQRASVAPTTGAFRWSSMHEAYGGGFRYHLTDTRNVLLEAAKGSDGMNVYFTLESEF